LGVRESIADLSLLEAALSRPMVPNKDIFPRLQKLRISCHVSRETQLRFATTFLHDGITQLQFVVTHIELDPDSDVPYHGHFILSEATLRCPNISRVLYLVSPGVNPVNTDFLEECTQYLPQWKHLRAVTMSTQVLVSEMLVRFEDSEFLEELRAFGNIETFALEWNHPPNNSLPLSPRFHARAFAKLSHLELFDTLESIDGLFNFGHVFPNLHSIFVTAPWGNDGRHINSYLQHLAGSCPRLQRIGISRRKFPDVDVPVQEAEEMPINFHVLSSLTRVQNLAEFRLEHAWPVKMNDEELTQVISNCPQLRILHLNSNPLYPTATPIRLKALEMLSERCPWLEDLALYVNSGGEAEFLTTGTMKKVFQRLSKVHFGRSPVSITLSTDKLLSYFSQVLPPSCDVVSESGVGLSSLISESPDYVLAHAVWSDISGLWRQSRDLSIQS